MKNFRVWKALIVFQIHYFKGKTEEKTQQTSNFSPAARCELLFTQHLHSSLSQFPKIVCWEDIFWKAKLYVGGGGAPEGRIFGGCKNF